MCYNHKSQYHPFFAKGGKYGYKKWGKHRGFRQNNRSLGVNVREEDDSYYLFLYAAGLSKGDFKISVEDHILTLKIETTADDFSREADWKRQEYSPNGYHRQFELSETIDTSAISAEYTNGVLKLSLPKLAGHETKRSDISVD